MRELIASARPKDHRVYSIIDKHNCISTGRVYSFCRVRKRELTEEQCIFCLIKQVAKVVLRRVKIINKLEDKNKW